MSACIMITIISPGNQKVIIVKAITNQVYPAIPTLDKDGSVAIDMHNFLNVGMLQYKDDMVVKMLRPRPAFKREA